MCGIAGLIEYSGVGRAQSSGQGELSRRAGLMASAIAYRGPDAQGVWADEALGVALAHRRLSILDLSPTGAQPMHSRTGRYVLTFNGEIYGFRELREKLEIKGHLFRGRSDTEVMLAAFEEWGVASTLSELDGMFAFAVWDRENRELWLARDRLGEKPLFYGWNSGVFLFGSELKALRAHPAWSGKVDRSALSLFFRYNCVPAPYCVYEGVRKLMPGHLLRLDTSTAVGDFPVPKAYWSLRDVAQSARQAPFSGDEREAVTHLDALLSKVVSQRMVSDVPIGAFLSGGIDSSLITALMQKNGQGPTKTFTIGFSEQEYNEAHQARKIAAHLGTEHTEILLSSSEALAVVPELPRVYDEPFADSSQIATLLVARHARKSVTVCLSGDAGDELFAGYHRHFAGERIWRTLRWVPRPLRRSGAAALRDISASSWSRIGSLSGRSPQFLADRAQKLSEALPFESAKGFYLALVSQEHEPLRLVLSSTEPMTLPTRVESSSDTFGSVVADFQYLDSMTYLPDDILTKVDRATMAASLEARVPFLSPEVLRFAWSLPDSMKVRDGQGKWILRRLLSRYLPAELILKPKSGFAVPIAAWLRGPLKAWAEGLLEERTLRSQGYLNLSEVSLLWKEHQDGTRNHQDRLWGILMFQSWLKEYEGDAS